MNDLTTKKDRTRWTSCISVAVISHCRVCGTPVAPSPHISLGNVKCPKCGAFNTVYH